MGWTFVSDYRGEGIKTYLNRELEALTDTNKWEVLDSAMVGFRRYYAACRRTDKATGQSVTFAAIFLVQYIPRSLDGFTLGWKDMDESMGPVQVDCPLRILDHLDPPRNDEARAWRERVRAYHASRKKRPKVGDTLRFANALTFTDGCSEDLFRVEQWGKRTLRYRGLTTGGIYRITNIQSQEFTTIGNLAGNPGV